MLTDAIEVSGAALSGMSGGPAIDAAGNVVGVIEAGFPDGSVTYLTPATDLQHVHLSVPLLLVGCDPPCPVRALGTLDECPRATRTGID